MDNFWKDQNRAAWNERVRRNDWYIDTAKDSDFLNPLAVADPVGWLETVADKRVLCLAAGGGRHGPLLAAAGARVTVVDLSPQMLELDRKVASARSLAVATIEASMDDLGPLADGQFDAVIQPVSTCYVPDVSKVYREVARVLRDDGVYVSQHKQPVSLQASAGPVGAHGKFVIKEPYLRDGPLPPEREGCMHREEGTAEHLHRLGELLGGLCRSGFVIEDVAEPDHAKPGAEIGTFAYRCRFVPPYLAIKARRVAGRSPGITGSGIILA
jgi:SAM-dependent methyltransferase